MVKIRYKFEWISSTLFSMGLVVGLVSTLVANLANAAEGESQQVPPSPDELLGENTPNMRQFIPISQLSDNKTSQATSQVTSVSQLSDVKTTDWAFQALQSLVERYGCIVGYDDKTYRGNRAVSRYEFAAGLNACMTRINELIAAGTPDLVKKEDLVTLQNLRGQFANELATLRGRVDALEARTVSLQAQQFSTTTTLRGEIEYIAGGIVAGDRADGRPADHNITLQDRVRLVLETSFTGKDLLLTQFTAGNIASLGGVRSGILLSNDGKLSDKHKDINN